jgi:hypothetical protein
MLLVKKKKKTHRIGFRDNQRKETFAYILLCSGLAKTALIVTALGGFQVSGLTLLTNLVQSCRSKFLSFSICRRS